LILETGFEWCYWIAGNHFTVAVYVSMSGQLLVVIVGHYLSNVFAASQVVSKPVTTSATEVKTEQPSQSTEPASDAVSTDVKQESPSAASEAATSAVEAMSGSEVKSEDKPVAVEDSDNEEKMDTDTSEPNKTEEAAEEVSFTS